MRWSVIQPSCEIKSHVESRSFNGCGDVLGDNHITIILLSYAAFYYSCTNPVYPSSAQAVPNNLEAHVFKTPLLGLTPPEPSMQCASDGKVDGCILKQTRGNPSILWLDLFQQKNAGGGRSGLMVCFEI